MQDPSAHPEDPSPDSDDGAGDSDPAQTQPMLNARLEQLDHFTIEARIGEGGMGVVYRAYDPDLHRTVAIKKIHPRYEGDEEYASRFLTEARAVAAAVHPNIAQIFSIHARDETAPPYFVMEYVDGESVEARVQQQGPIPVPEAIDIAFQAARGLRAAHRKGIVHRDVKPSNILLTQRGDVKLVDFGLARRTEDLSHLTQVGVILGTPHFVSPEQSQGHHVDHRSDIYSLGCTLYFLLTGKEPFVGSTKVEVIVAHANEPAPHLESPPFLRSIDTLLQKMLAKAPEERHQDYQGLLDDLTTVRRQLRGGRRGVTRRMLNWAAALLILCGIGLGASMLGPGHRSPTTGYTPQKLFGTVYHAEGENEGLDFKFARSDLQKFFRYSPDADDAFPPPRPPRVEGEHLSWRNFDRPITFPYMKQFHFVEVLGLEFRGSPDFELVVGYDPEVPENQLRVFFGSDGRPNRSVFECWQGGKRVAIQQDQKHVDFTLNDRASYNVKLTRTADNTYDFVIEQNATSGTSERERIRFTLPDEQMLEGAIALRGAGLRPQGWGVSVREVVIGGRLDHPRIGRELLLLE
ncbi:MAG: serine/threonine-protein kinase [Planctomycetota bacterium]